ncbi:unnamed protein product [Brassica rapa subsp. narinosa]
MHRYHKPSNSHPKPSTLAHRSLRSPRKKMEEDHGLECTFEILWRNHGLNFTLWKFWAHCDVNKSPGTNAANLQFSVGLNCTIESAEVLGPMCC